MQLKVGSFYAGSSGSLILCSFQLTEAEEDWLKIALFISGGHYAFVKYADVVNREVENLLEGVLNANIKPALAIDLVEGVNQTEYKLTDEPALNKKEVASDSSFKPKSAYGFSFQK